MSRPFTQIAALKKRRDELLNRACTRHERPALMAEVRRITRQIWELEGRRRKR